MAVPYPMPRQQRPSLIWLILPIALLLGGAGSCSGLVYSGIRNAVDGQIYNSSGRIQLDKGKYTVYAHDAHATLATQDGTPLQLKDYESDVTFTRGSTQYQADKTFTTNYTGTYRLTVDGDGAVAIGHGLGHDASTIGIGFGPGALLGVVGMVSLIVILVRRSQNHPGPPGGYPVSAYGYPGQAPYSQYGRQPGYGIPQQYGQQPGYQAPPQQPPGYGQQPGYRRPEQR